MSETTINALDTIIYELEEGEFFELVSRLKKIKYGVTSSLDSIIEELEEGDFLMTANKLSQIKKIWTETEI